MKHQQLTLTCSNCGETCGIEIIAGWGTDEEEYLSDCCEELILGNGSPMTQIELKNYYREQQSWRING